MLKGLIAVLVLVAGPVCAAEEVGQKGSSAEIVEHDTQNTKSVPAVESAVPGPFPADRRTTVVPSKDREMVQGRKERQRAREIRRIEHVIHTQNISAEERARLDKRLGELQAEQMVNSPAPAKP